MLDVAIVGAGPYGLSIAAHLSALGLDFRIFGKAMETWTTRMPQGMRLKSEGFASTLYDPAGAFPFSVYCAEHGLPYADAGLPVDLQNFSDYGRAFQRRFVPMLEDKQVVAVLPRSAGYEIVLDDGETTLARRVILAVGITHFARTAAPLSALPPALVSHASSHHDMSRFKGQRVAVVGGGSSATDCAATLVEAGASVHLIARRTDLRFHTPPKPRSLRDRLLWPTTTIGAGWKAMFCTRAPLAFHALPEAMRLEITRRYLGPASCWFTRAIIERQVKVRMQTTVTHATIRDGRAVLYLQSPAGASEVVADHVVAATGYAVNLDRLTFLDPVLRAGLAQVAKTPVLSRNFESSAPGLFFVGVASANAFGPVVRFACGADFTARRLTRHLARTRLRSVAGAAVERPLTVSGEERSAAL